MSNIAYICNRKRCGDRCSAECTHTTDINYAANFKHESGTHIEIERSSYESQTAKKAN